MSGELVSIQVGRPQIIDGSEPWETSFFKIPVAGRVRLETCNLEGDEQADLSVHGGPDKAVCVYSVDHFDAWSIVLGSQRCEPGAFGENFSVRAMAEDTVCLGDVYEVGTTTVQVSQPRGPCWKLGRRWGRLDMPRLVMRSGRTGWYFRVLKPGHVAAGDRFSLVDRPGPAWNILRVNEVFYARDPGKDSAARRALAECAALSESWRAALLRDP
jgi:MOSC domain-containing protein YiiM